MTELTKVCTKCGEEKVVSAFSRNGKWLRSQCKECSQLYYQNNKESIKQYNKDYYEKYYQNNKESIITKSVMYNQKNKESIKEKNKKYYQKNKQLIDEKNKAYKKNNKESIMERTKEYVKARRKTDIGFRIRQNIRCILAATYKRCSTNGKQVPTASIVNQEAMDHLIATKPTDDLKYHIDHIIPISAFNVDDVEHLKLAHVKENLRWLEASANMSKNDSIDWKLIESCPKLTEIAKIIGLKKNLDIAA